MGFFGHWVVFTIIGALLFGAIRKIRESGWSGLKKVLGDFWKDTMRVEIVRMALVTFVCGIVALLVLDAYNAFAK